jgi:GNAT superfamily N-acetyltransferase
MSFIKSNWGGHDYIPRVWDEWLKSKTGEVFVAEVDGIPVGMSRIKFLDDGSAWLEAARVHPDFRGLGLATMLGENLVQVGRDRGAKVFRLTSRALNRPAHRNITRMNFKETSRVSIYEPKERARFSVQKGVKRMGVQDVAEAINLITKSREFKLGSGVYWDAYEAISLTPSIIEKLVRMGVVWTIGTSVAITITGGIRGETWKQVSFLTGKGDEPLRLVKHFLGLKEKKQASIRMVWIPQGSRVIGSLRKAGFNRRSSQVLFERSS